MQIEIDQEIIDEIDALGYEVVRVGFPRSGEGIAFNDSGRVGIVEVPNAEIYGPRVIARPKFRIEVGKWYMTRDGYGPFRVLSQDLRTGINTCKNKEGWWTLSVYEDGKFLKGREHELDLVREVPAPTKRVEPTHQMITDAGGSLDVWVKHSGVNWCKRRLVAIVPGAISPFLTVDPNGVEFWDEAEVEVPCE